MQALNFSVILIIINIIINQVSSQQGQPHEMKFKVPQMTDEENESLFLPEKGMLKCDGCKAIVYQLYSRFQSYNDIHPARKYQIKDSDLIELFEKTCTTDIFNLYGIKEIDGVKRMSGPGSFAENKAGVISGGAKWPSRMVDMCEQFIGDIGERDIYDKYAEKPKSRKALENFLCYGSGLTGSCTDIKPEDPKPATDEPTKTEL